MTISNKHWSKTNKREETIKKCSVGWSNLIPKIKLGENVKCPICGKEHYVKRCYLLKNKGKYCSRKCNSFSRRGIIPPNLEMARKNSPIQKGKCPFKRIGKDHWNWQGGKTEINHKIRTSEEYKKWRTSVFERDNYTCVNCGERGGELVADHIKPFCDYPELRLNLENGRTLCHTCDKQIGWNFFKERNPKLQ